MAIHDIPGYVQGFIFSDESSTYYDSVGKVFRDQAGFGSFNDLTITVGTPAFVTDSGRRGMTLDNTVQGRFLPPITWEGFMLTVMKPVMSTNATIYPVIFGVATSVSSNGRIGITRASSTDYRHSFATVSATLNPISQFNTGDMGGIKIGAFAVSQETRKGYSTKDGITVTEYGPVASATSGVTMAGSLTTRTDGQWARFGNISGTIDNTTVSSNTMTIFELHFFKGTPLSTSLSTIAAEIAALKTKYSAT